jgi:biopolymer transport protein ExbB
VNEFIEKAGSYFSQGGWIMFPLAAVSIAMWALIIDRFRTFGSMTSGDISIKEAIARIRSNDNTPCSEEGLRACLVSSFVTERAGDPKLDKEILGHCAMRQRLGLTRYLMVIAVMATIAPLLGLLGTVLGMIETFDVISLFGTGNAKAMAGGISVALITTQTGLLVAIPGLFLSGVLNRRARHLKVRLDEFTMILGRVLLQSGEVKVAQKGAESGEPVFYSDLQTAH